MERRVHLSVAATVAATLACGSAAAADPAFQNFFTAVCGGPTSGGLAARCASTPGGGGNLSGDSESSLNPSQALLRNQPAVGTALTRTKAARERGERSRETDGKVAQSADGRFSLLLNVHVSDLDRDAPVNTADRSFESDSRALELGIDYRWSDRAVLGAIVGAERVTTDFDAEAVGVNFTPAANAGDSESDNRYLTVFGNWAVGKSGFIELSAGYERSDGRYRRYSVFQESTRTIAQTNVTVSGDADGDARWVSANGGVDFARDAWNFGPFIGLSSVRATLDGYTEQDLAGSGLNMRISSTTRRSLVAHAGLRISRTISGSAGVFIPQLRVEMQRDFNDDLDAVTASFVQDPRNTSLALTGTLWDRSGVNAGFSVSGVLPNGWMPYFDYAIVLGYQGVDRQRATLGLRKEF